MRKKRHMRDGEYAAYRRIHAYAFPQETEEAKILREKAAADRLQRRCKTHLRQQLRRLRGAANASNEATLTTVDEALRQARRELGNARTHKNRLHALQQRRRRKGIE